LPIKLELGSKNNLDLLNEHLPFQAVIHSAAKLPHSLLNDEDIDNYYHCNVTGTRYLLDWALKSNIKIFSYLSGVGSFNPQNGAFNEEMMHPKPNHYHISKAIGELLCRTYNEMGLRTVSLRVSAPYGYVSNQSVLPKFIKFAKQDKNIELWGSGSRSQVFTFVEDIGYACSLAMGNKSVNGCYNISGNKSITMIELAKMVLDSIPNTKSKIVFLNTDDPEEGQKRNISLQKAKREMGFEPQFNLLAGLRLIINDHKKHFWSSK
jgi:nucleoside-diphosphate-sugar epimerase